MKKFAAVIAVMALCSAPVMAAERRFFWPSATQSQAGGFQGAERQRNDRRKRKILRDDTAINPARQYR